MILRYTIFIISFLGVLGIGSYSIYQVYSFTNILGPNGDLILLLLLIIMPIIFITTMIIGNKKDYLINNYLYTISCLWLPILLYLFLGSVIITILMVFIPVSNIAFYNFVINFIIFLSIFLTIYGLINAGIFNIKKVLIPKENPLNQIWHGKKIVLVADTHIGMIYKKNFLNKVVNFINKQNPDLILFAGDLIDGPKFTMEKTLEPLANLSAKLGIYYAPGNHESYSHDDKDLYTILAKYMTVLRDNKVNINNTDIVGLSYDAKETIMCLQNRLIKSNYNKENPTILIRHTSKDNEFLQKFGINLTVSGHTHGGQIWPFTIGAKAIFKKYIHGLNIQNNNASITTTGIGTWGPPVRIGTKPEIIVITFE